MKAYIVLGPTKLQPLVLRSLDKAMDCADVVIAPSVWGVRVAGRLTGSGSNCQK